MSSRLNNLKDFEDAVRTVKAVPSEARDTKRQLLEAVISEMTTGDKVPPQLQSLWRILFIDSEERASRRMRAIGKIAETSWSLTDQQAAKAIENFQRQQRSP